MQNDLIENKSWKFWFKVKENLPFDFRQKIKNKQLPKLLDFIKWSFIDLARPREFHPYGLDFFCGLPGVGKTIFVTKLLTDYRNKYGNNIFIATNFNYKYQDFSIKSFEDLVKIYEKPIVIGYDEMQNDFDARNWQNFSYGISERITQSRKLKGMKILATTQRFAFVDKRLRELTNNVYECATVNRRLTVAKIFEPRLKEKLDNGIYIDMDSIAFKGFDWFVQSDELRSLYGSFNILQSIRDQLESPKNSSVLSPST